MLIPIFKEHDRQMEALINKEFAYNTHKRYETSLNYVQDFLKYKYSLQDIPIKNINLAFVNDFDFYLRTVQRE